MIDPRHGLPICRQAKLVSISRSNVYYLPRPVADADLAVMRRMDELHLNYPFAGARMLRDMLGREGIQIGRRHVGTLMRKMGIEAIYRKRNTSAPHPEHRIYPYLLKHLAIERPNHVWATDLTYIPMKRGFVYLVAIVDWATRKVLAHRLSITMTPDFCVEALEEAIARYGVPEIFNTDQGSQFTSADWTLILSDAKVKISMDGRGRFLDNIFIERLWRSLKQEAIYLTEIEDGFHAERIIDNWFDFYNTLRPHTALQNQTPDQAYHLSGMTKLAA